MKILKISSIISMLLVLLALGCKKDDDPGINPSDRPTVTLTDPLNNAVDVDLNQSIITTFSEAMSATSINNTSYSLKQGSTVIAGTVSYSGTSATFNPTTDLDEGTLYTVVINTDAKNMNGIGLANDYTFSFTTGDALDIIIPTVLTADPLANATGVARNKQVRITFSESMDASTINSTTFTLKKGLANVGGTVTYSGTTAVYTPTFSLDANTLYTAQISTGVKDLAGNALATSTIWNFTTGTESSLAIVNLGTSGDFVILAKTAISNVPTSVITGDIGISPAAESFITGFTLTAATGFSTATEVTGKVYAADQASPTPMLLTTAVNDMTTAYNDAAGRPTPDFFELGTGLIGGLTLTPGLYKWTNTVLIASDVTISGGANDIWIFQIAGDLTMSSAVNITLAGNAQAKNIFWQVAGEATLGTDSHFEGTILSMTGITLQTRASMNGRALAQSAVILDESTVTNP